MRESNHVVSGLTLCILEVIGLKLSKGCNIPMYPQDLPIVKKFHDPSQGTVRVPGLYIAGSDAFLPSVVGAMYGGCLGACAVLVQLGCLRLGRALLSHLTERLQEENPKLTWHLAYCGTIHKFMT